MTNVATNLVENEAKPVKSSLYCFWEYRTHSPLEQIPEGPGNKTRKDVLWGEELGEERFLRLPSILQATATAVIYISDLLLCTVLGTY